MFEFISNFWGIGLVLVLFIFIVFKIFDLRTLALNALTANHQSKLLQIGEHATEQAKEKATYAEDLEMLKLRYIAGIVLFFFIAAVLCLYLWKFNGLAFGDTADVWGQMGDYFGGMLNPIFAFASFMALLYTINIQSKQLTISTEELRETRKEMTRSASAQEESQKALQEQVKLATDHNKLTYLHDLLKAADDRVMQVSYSRCESVSSEIYATNIGVFYQTFDQWFPVKNVSHYDSVHKNFRVKFNRELSLFETQIQSSLLELFSLLEGYKKEGGLDSVYAVYKSRHSETVARLTYIGTFKRYGKVAEMFGVEEMLVSLGLADKPKPVDISPQ